MAQLFQPGARLTAVEPYTAAAVGFVDHEGQIHGSATPRTFRVTGFSPDASYCLRLSMAEEMVAPVGIAERLNPM